MDARRVIMGDWGPVVRDPMDLWRAGLVIAAVVSGVSGDLTGAGYLAVSAAVTLAARLVDLPRMLDLALLVALTVTGAGEALGFYDRWPPFDRIVHFVVPMLLSFVLYIALARLELVPDPRDDLDRRRLVALGINTFALGMAVGGLWEVAEYGSDAGFGSNLSENNDDTVGDLVADALGAMAGGVLMVLWTTKGWGSVRRIPGENRFEDTND